MSGEINWSALPIICEIYGVNDVEGFIAQLITIRKAQSEQGQS